MKGIVFTEFLEMVEDKFSYDVVDEILEQAELESGGIYTAVGTYPVEEMVSLLVALSANSGFAVPQLLYTFGEHLFTVFATRFPAFFQEHNSAFTFLTGIESIIHTEVRKLYPDAELPYFEVEQKNSDVLILTYHSARHLEDLAEGLIEGCIVYFNCNIVLERENITEGEDYCTRFTLTQK